MSATAGRGRGRGRGRSRRDATRAPEVASPFGGVPARECESCRTAPGIPFCRVEWSFLCTGCAAVVHGHNWIVTMPPNTNLNSNACPYPFSHPYHFPNANPSPNPNPNPNADANQIVQLSSDEDGPSSAEPAEDGSGDSKRRRRSGEGELPLDRAASVMRYKEKRNSRNFDKTVRYEKRKVYADSRPRIDGKFAKVADAAEDQTPPLDSSHRPIPDSSQNVRTEADEGAAEANVDGQLGLDAAQEEVNTDDTFVVGNLLDGGLELRQIESSDGMRLQ